MNHDEKQFRNFRQFWVETTEELAALPCDSVLMSSSGNYYVKYVDDISEDDVCYYEQFSTEEISESELFSRANAKWFLVVHDGVTQYATEEEAKAAEPKPLYPIE